MKLGFFREYIGISYINENIAFFQLKNWSKELLERSIDLQTVKMGESDQLMVFSKRYVGFFEIFIFYPILDPLKWGKK